jgi:hypothetical protein
LKLPAFDRLAADATVFTHVAPAGMYTHDVLPSLMTGIHADQIRSSSDGLLSIHDAATDRWRRFDQHDTVFEDALNDGYSTGVAGWYNPYCRILPQVLDHCFWTNHFLLPSGFFADQSFTVNLLTPITDFASRAFNFVLLKKHPNMQRATQLHADDYRSLFAAADALLADQSVDFMLLHMPVPHPGGIYDRRTSRFATNSSSYIDNLALADLYLAHLRRTLEQQGTWDSTAIVIMGDHSWRTELLWEKSSFWTAEDDAASSHGQFDDRPAYIVKMPEQRQAVRMDAPFAAMRTRALFDGLLDGRLSSTSDLTAWVQQQSQTAASHAEPRTNTGMLGRNPLPSIQGASCHPLKATVFCWPQPPPARTRKRKIFASSRWTQRKAGLQTTSSSATAPMTVRM